MHCFSVSVLLSSTFPFIFLVVPYKSTPSLEVKQAVPSYSLHSHASSAHSLADATGLFSSMSGNLTHTMDPTDRDKRNVALLPGRGQLSPLKHDAQIRSHVPIGVFTYGDQVSDSVRGGHLNLERYPLRPAQAVSPGKWLIIFEPIPPNCSPLFLYFSFLLK